MLWRNRKYRHTNDSGSACTKVGYGYQLRGGSSYLPAWTLTDESKEDASRISSLASASQENTTVRMARGSGDSAAIIIVGDEIVSGVVEEDTSHSLGSGLRQAGVAVKQVTSQ